MKVVDIPKPETKTDVDLISFLELQLEMAKAGETLLFSAISMRNQDSKFIQRKFFKTDLAKWHLCLAFTEIMQQEVERFRQFIKETYE